MDHNQVVAERNLKAILDAAERLLDRGEQITISAVAAEAGLSRVTVYAHFGTREQLLQGVGERAAQRVAAALDEAALDEGSALDALDRGLALAWQFLDQHQAIVHATGSHLSTDARRHLHGPVLVRMEGLIERGRRQGSLRTDLPTEWLLASFYALIHAAADEVRMGRLQPSAAHAVLKTTVHDVLGRRECTPIRPTPAQRQPAPRKRRYA
jgi:AcrR family transcriptional regulator